MSWNIVDFSTAPGYKIKMDYQGGTNVIYVGWSTPGALTSEAKWSIRKLTYDGSSNVTDIQWMNNSVRFDQVWDNRTASSTVYS